MHEKIKRRLKSGNVCYHSVQNLLSSSLLPKNISVKIYTELQFFLLLYIVVNLVSHLQRRAKVGCVRE